MQSTSEHITLKQPLLPVVCTPFNKRKQSVSLAFIQRLTQITIDTICLYFTFTPDNGDNILIYSGKNLYADDLVLWVTRSDIYDDAASAMRTELREKYCVKWALDINEQKQSTHYFTHSNKVKERT